MGFRAGLGPGRRRGGRSRVGAVAFLVPVLRRLGLCTGDRPGGGDDRGGRGDDPAGTSAFVRLRLWTTRLGSRRRSLARVRGCTGFLELSTDVGGVVGAGVRGTEELMSGSPPLWVGGGCRFVGTAQQSHARSAKPVTQAPQPPYLPPKPSSPEPQPKPRSPGPTPSPQAPGLTPSPQPPRPHAPQPRTPPHPGPPTPRSRKYSSCAPTDHSAAGHSDRSTSAYTLATTSGAVVSPARTASSTCAKRAARCAR